VSLVSVEVVVLGAGERATRVVARSIQPIDVHPVTNGKDSTEARA